MNYTSIFTLLIPVVPGFLFSGCADKPERVNPNIVIIFADDMGYGDVSALNPESRIQTPAIDALVSNGIAFSDAHASASVCTPSRYGLLTGRFAFRSERGGYGIGGFDKPVLEQDRETLAHVLKRAGYTTACIGKWHLGLDWSTRGDSGVAVMDKNTGYSNVDYSRPVTGGPNDFGFDYSFIHPASLDIPPYVFLRNQQAVDPDVILTTDVYPKRMENTQYAWDKKHSDEQAVYWEKGVWWRQGEMSRSFRVESCLRTIVNEGISFIEKQVSEKPRQPFFLYLPLTGPHTPWMPEEPFQGKSAVGKYGDFVLNIDHVVQQVIEVLEKNGIRENTMVIFASDNGAYCPDEEIALNHHDSNWGIRGQKGDIWEGGHRTPLVISWPAGISQPGKSHQLVSLTDLFATFSEMTAQPVSPGQGEDSYSLWPLISGTADTTARKSMIHHSSRDMYSIRSGEWKYIDGLGSGGFTSPAKVEPTEGGPAGQLYHLGNDPEESENLYLAMPEKVNEMQDLLNRGK